MYDRTTIVLCSEMGRTIQGDVRTIVNDASKTVSCGLVEAARYAGLAAVACD